MSWLTRWFAARAPQPRRFILLYGRRGCHLCDVAKELLLNRKDRFGFAFEERDVDEDPGWLARYGECVPVVFVDGKLRFRGRVEPALLDRLLRVGSGQASDPEFR
jgi:glutaredoxin